MTNSKYSFFNKRNEIIKPDYDVNIKMEFMHNNLSSIDHNFKISVTDKDLLKYTEGRAATKKTF